MKYYNLGNASFNIEALKDISFDDFLADYAGKLSGYDIKKAYKVITGKDGIIKEPEIEDTEVETRKSPGRRSKKE